MKDAAFRHVCEALGNNPEFNSAAVRAELYKMDDSQLELVLSYYTPQDIMERFTSILDRGERS